MSRRRWVLAALAGAAIVLVAGRALAALYVTHRWFEALGLPSIATMWLAGEVLLRGGTTALAILFVFANLYAVRRSVVSLVLPRTVGDLEFGEEVPGAYLAAAAAALAVLVGTFLGLSGDAWPQFALALDGVPFGERDPYRERDLGFYVGWLPAELLLFAWAQRLLLVTAVLVPCLYALTPSLRWRRRSLYVSEYVRRHFTVLGGVLLVLFAWGFRLESYTLLLDGSGIGGAFSAIDLRVRVPGSLVLSAVALATGIIVIWAGVVGQIRLAFLAVSAMLLLSVATRYVLPPMLSSSATPSGERPFAETRDAFTRRAFGSDQVMPSTPDAALFIASPGAVSLWDAPALRRAVDGAAAVGWARAGAELHAVVPQRGFVAGGELTPWTVTRVDAARSGLDGEPVPVNDAGGHLAEVLPPVVTIDSAPEYRIVPDAAARIRGASLADVPARLAHAWALQNFRILLGTLPAPEPVMVLLPGLADRLAAVLPFLVTGDVARPAIAGDSLYWVVDVYAASASYPLSESLVLAGGERRYFHPAGHAIVNSATGEVRVAPVAQPGPIVRSWMRLAPALFVDAQALGGEMRDALLPHREALQARALVFARLGRRATDAPTERRHLAVEHGADSLLAGSATPLALHGPEGLALAVPVLDARDRVAGIVVAATHSTRSWWIPAPGIPRFWNGVLDALLTADSTAARRGARPVRGPTRVIPYAGSFTYAQPTYLWPVRGGPVRAAVTTLSDGGVSTGASLLSAPLDTLSSLPGERSPSSSRELYDRMRTALRRGDWETFGAALDSLGHVLGATPR